MGIFGFGASAHITIQVAIHLNCEVYVFTRSEEHRLHAEELGAVWSGGSNDDPGVELDSVLIFAPSGVLYGGQPEKFAQGGNCSFSRYSHERYTKVPLPPSLRRKSNDERHKCHSSGRPGIPGRTEVKLYQLEQANQALLDLKQSRIKGAAVLTID